MGNSNRGKFAERIKRILLARKKKNVNKVEVKPVEKKPVDNTEVKLQDSKEIYTNFMKVVSVIPAIVYDNIVINDNVTNHKETVSLSQETIRPDLEKKVIVDRTNTVQNKKNEQEFRTPMIDKSSVEKGAKYVGGSPEKKKQVKNIDVEEIKKKQESFDRPVGVSESKNKDNDKRIKELEKSIINLIKKDLIKIVNQMEILQSELYVLSEVNGDSKTLKECQKELDKVKSILCKIDKLKEQYEFLRDNYDFEYLLEIDNHDLVDKIIELRDSFGNNELKAVAHDYKLLDAYKFLYLKLDSLQDKTALFEEKKKEEELKLKERDIDFNALKKDVYSVQSTNKNYESFIKSQNELLSELGKQVSKIEAHEETDMHLKGFNQLFKNSFKYFGLLMISPLKGLIPAIATETLITSNLIKNLYHNLEWEESKKMVYEAIDYSNVISGAIDDLENTNRIVDMTLDDIVQLKMRYNDKFRMYQGDFREYRDIMSKINDMENKILGNKMKIEMMRAKALEQQRANHKKLALVKELNSK